MIDDRANSGRQYFCLGFICGKDPSVKAYVLIELDPYRVGGTLFVGAVAAYHVFLLDVPLNVPLNFSSRRGREMPGGIQLRRYIRASLSDR